MDHQTTTLSRAKKSEWTCLGTRSIAIADRHASKPSSSWNGMISLYRDVQRSSDDELLEVVAHRKQPSGQGQLGGDIDSDNDSGDCLHLLMTDGSHTFYEKLTSHDTKHMEHQKQNDVLDQISTIILTNGNTGDGNKIFEDDKKYLISYEHASRSIRVSIRKRINHLVRPVWEGQLSDIRQISVESLPRFMQHAICGSSSSLSTLSQSQLSSTFASLASTGLPFSAMLGETIAKLQREIVDLKNENQQLQTNAFQWKSVNEKLSSRLDVEKSELTERFLVLFNQHKARHIQTKKELDEMKAKMNHQQQQGGGPESNTTQNGFLKDKEAVIDHEDEHDYAVYDDAMVERLAAGPAKFSKAHTHSRGVKTEDNQIKNMGEKRKQPSKTQCRDNISVSQSTASSGYVNPHTGAIEITNYKEMFSSSDEDDGDVCMKKWKKTPDK